MSAREQWPGDHVGQPGSAETSGTPLAAGQGRSVVVDPVSLVRNFCIAFSNVRVFTFQNEAAQKSFEKIWEQLREALNQSGDAVLSLAEGKLLYSGFPINERNQSISRFTKAMTAFNISNLVLERDMSKDELHALFSVLTRDPVYIGKLGGIDAVFETNDVTHIRPTVASYQLVHGDGLVARTDGAGVPERAASTAARPDPELVRQLVEEILQHFEKHTELLEELHREPAGFVGRLVQLIDCVYATDGVDRDHITKDVQQNINALGQRMAQPEGEQCDAGEGVSAALLGLEAALRKSMGSPHSAGASEFLQHLTGILSTYSAGAKADLVLGELNIDQEEDENIARAVQLLSELAPDVATRRYVLDSLRERAAGRDLDASALIAQAEANLHATSRARTAKRAQMLSPVAEHLRNELRQVGGELPAEKFEDIASYLDNAIAFEVLRAVREATAALEQQCQMLQDTLKNADNALQGTDVGLILVDGNGIVTHLWYIGDQIAGIEVGKPLPLKLAQMAMTLQPGDYIEYDNIRIIQARIGLTGWVESLLFLPLDNPQA